MAIKTFTTGEVLTAADTNTYLANSGLVYVTQQTIGNAVSSVTVSNCFTSTYDNYRITFSYGACSGVPDIRLGLAGITNGWYVNGYNQQAGSATLNGMAAANSATCLVAIGETQHYNYVAEVQSPFLAKGKFVVSQYGAQGGNTYVGVFNGVNGSTTSAASFTISPSGGTLTGGVITVYGYRKA